MAIDFVILHVIELARASTAAQDFLLLQSLLLPVVAFRSTFVVPLPVFGSDSSQQPIAAGWMIAFRLQIHDTIQNGFFPVFD
jgi:hypothetical protein